MGLRSNRKKNSKKKDKTNLLSGSSSSGTKTKIQSISDMIAEAYVNTLLSLYEGEGLNQLLNIQCDYTENVIDMTDAVFAYSLRRFTSSYTGYAIGVQKSDNSDLINIPFTSDGLLDTDYLISSSDSTSLYITVWYDQSGNGIDMISEFETAPKIIDSDGNITMINNLPAVNFDSSTKTKFTSSITLEEEIISDISLYTVFSNNYTDKTTSIPLLYIENSIDDTIENSMELIYTGMYGNPQYKLYNTVNQVSLNTITTTMLDDNVDADISFVQYFQSDSDQARDLIINNNVQQTDLTVSDIIFPIGTNVTIGTNSDSTTYFDGYVQEIIFLKSNTSYDRNSIVNNINYYYGLSDLLEISSLKSYSTPSPSPSPSPTAPSQSIDYISEWNKLPSAYYNECVQTYKDKGYSDSDIRTICDYHKKCDISYIELGQNADLDISQVSDSDVKSTFLSMLKSSFVQEAYNSGDSFNSGDLFDQDSDGTSLWDDIYEQILDFQSDSAQTFLTEIQEAVIDQYVQVKNGRTAGSISLKVLADIVSSQLLDNSDSSSFMDSIYSVIEQETEVDESGLSELIMWIIYIVLIIIMVVMAGFVIYLIFQYYTLYVGT